MIYVIRSGPAGVSTTSALVNKGRQVTMLGAGFDLEPEQAGIRFFYDLDQNRDALKAEDIFFGFSRLAVKFYQDQENPGCPSCGMCLYGCPYGNIYSIVSTLDQFKGRKMPW